MQKPGLVLYQHIQKPGGQRKSQKADWIDNSGCLVDWSDQPANRQRTGRMAQTMFFAGSVFFFGYCHIVPLVRWRP